MLPQILVTLIVVSQVWDVGTLKPALVRHESGRATEARARPGEGEGIHMEIEQVDDSTEASSPDAHDVSSGRRDRYLHWGFIDRDYFRPVEQDDLDLLSIELEALQKERMSESAESGDLLPAQQVGGAQCHTSGVVFGRGTVHCSRAWQSGIAGQRGCPRPRAPQLQRLRALLRLCDATSNCRRSKVSTLSGGGGVSTSKGCHDHLNMHTSTGEAGVAGEAAAALMDELWGSLSGDGDWELYEMEKELGKEEEALLAYLMYEFQRLVRYSQLELATASARGMLVTSDNATVELHRHLYRAQSRRATCL